jgi:hypothetical protein
MSKKVFEFILRMEVDDGRLSLSILDLDEVTEDPSSFIEFEGPLDFTISTMDYCTTTSDISLEGRWDVTYTEK